MEDALKGGPTNLAVLPIALPAAGDAGEMHSCLPLAGSSYGATVPEFVIFEPVGSCCGQRCFTVCVDGVFSIRGVWEWDLQGSLTSNDQQFRMKLLSLCTGLHEKNPT